MGATGYNLQHLQIVEKGGSTWQDILYATTFQPTVDQTSVKMKADAKNAVTAWSAPDGGGSIGFGSADMDVIAMITGGVASDSGTGPTVIHRTEVKGDSTPPALSVAAWIPNVDGNQTSAGLRISLPNAQLSVPTTQYAQESWTEFTSNLSFVGDEDNVMLIWEDMVTAPVFTAGVIPVSL